MAVFKIFPIKDSFISSQYPDNNYGRDEILEISTTSDNNSRALLQFDQNEILNIVNNITGSYNVELKLYLAYASNIPVDYNIEIYPLSSSWDMGTGRDGDVPNPKNGVCWNFPKLSVSSSWNGGDINNYLTQSFNYIDNKDIKCDITPIINNWVNNNDNNGLLLKHTDLYESSSQSIITRFFSIDTHTIYAPYIEISWIDTNYSSSIPVINNSNIHSVIYNNKSTFKETENYTFRLKSRELYPTRIFQTSSIYLNNNILPEESYWSIRDLKTQEIVIDFNNGTKLGADNISNYFNIDMNGLYPERYYEIIIKTTIDDNVIIPNIPNNIFQIKR